MSWRTVIKQSLRGCFVLNVWALLTVLHLHKFYSNSVSESQFWQTKMSLIIPVVQNSWAQHLHTIHWVHPLGQLLPNCLQRTKQKLKSVVFDSSAFCFFFFSFFVFVDFLLSCNFLRATRADAAAFEQLAFSCKAAFTGVSVRIALFFLFLPRFCVFLGGAFGNGRTCSGENDVEGPRILHHLVE